MREKFRNSKRVNELYTRVFLLTMHACNPLSKTSSLTYATWIFWGHSLSFIEV